MSHPSTNEDLELLVHQRTRQLTDTNLRLTREIKERKSVEVQLRQSQQRFKDYAETAADWFWETDERLRYTYLSERYGEIAGVPVQRHIGRRRRVMIVNGFDIHGSFHLRFEQKIGKRLFNGLD